MELCSKGLLCRECAALKDELEDEVLFDHYRKKLLVRGWAGVMSPVERAYYRKHRTAEQSARAKATSERMKGTIPGGVSRVSDGGTP